MAIKSFSQTLLTSKSGFTLLEVLIALSIFAVVYGLIVVTQINSNLSIENSRKLTVAAMLLRNKMIETEELMEGKPFTELKEEEKGTFKGDQEVSEYIWERTVKEIEFPNLISPQSEGGSEDGDDDGGGSNELMQKVSQVTTKYFNDSIREVTVTIKWPTVKGTRSTSASTYWVDLTKNVKL